MAGQLKLTLKCAERKVVPAIAKTLTFRHMDCELIIHGITTPMANAIRRTLITDIAAVNMSFNYQDWFTDDEFLLVDMIRDRFRQIPVEQRAATTDGSLHVVNDSDTTINIWSTDVKTKLKMNKIQICSLRPGKTIKITKISTEETEYGLCFRAVAEPLDVKMWDDETKQGVRSHEATPKVFSIRWTTNGNLTGKDSVVRAVKALRLLINSPHEKTVVGDVTTIEWTTTKGHTLSNLIVREIIDQWTLCTAIPSVDKNSNKCSVRVINCPNFSMSTVIKNIDAILTQIERQL